ncbi:putative integral membrane protein [Candidatus Endolissoclinum faulkneri L2]|uniref:Protoporphyrinogen IX oxidase n=1 Tax=Candidatus Endolissoclinum faulkneri L2 TaxID=1193729 RepID=K7YQ69_9PROT|nr:protoporphyrinogen oxidase HemJ [Candidatus Endolissoclinum faulkneri]AFX99712.1 putative integral membrane protein [Candidatus Endolissoclinum faulkneri L2]
MEWYGIIKSLHLISVIAWMVGLLYLPRLFVYHANEDTNTSTSETFKIMELRLYRFIMNPAMMATWGFGITLLCMNWSLASNTWLHIKFFLIILLTVIHHIMGYWRKVFEIDKNKHSASFFRIMNEIPTILMVFVIFLVITKPF